MLMCELNIKLFVIKNKIQRCATNHIIQNIHMDAGFKKSEKIFGKLCQYLVYIINAYHLIWCFFEKRLETLILLIKLVFDFIYNTIYNVF